MSAHIPRRPLTRWVALVLALTACWAALQWPVTTRQGIDGHVSTQTIPLSIKLVRFWYRDLEYRALTRSITRGLSDDEAKLLALFDWVRAHVHRGTPPALAVVDDHVWHIIVRGYGEPDQLADVLATLCAYAGLPAQAVAVGPPGQGLIHSLTMVRLDDRWYPVDAYYGVLPREPGGRLLSRDELMADPALVRRAVPPLTVHGIEYAQLYAWLPALHDESRLRPYCHMPWRRAWSELTRRTHGH